MRIWLRGHGYAIRATLARLALQPLSVLLNVVAVGIALSLPLTGYTLLASLQPLTGRLAEEAEVSVFAKLDASRTETESLGARLRALPGVLEARLVSREDALARLKAQPGMAEVLAALNLNPLPDTWVLRLRHTGAVANQEELARQVRGMPGVDHVQIDTDWLRRLEALLRLARTGLALLAGALGLAVIAVIFNTIRLQVATQRDEIAVARLVGATRGFVRRPFYYLGGLQGLLGGAVALGLMHVALVPLNEAVAEFARLYNTRFAFIPPEPPALAIFLAGAAALGWLGAALSLGRHMNERPGGQVFSA